MTEPSAAKEGANGSFRQANKRVYIYIYISGKIGRASYRKLNQVIYVKGHPRDPRFCFSFCII